MSTNEVLNHINRYGIDGSEVQLAWLARRSLAVNAAPAIAALLTDTTASNIVRERAAARTVAALEACRQPDVIQTLRWSVA